MLLLSLLMACKGEYDLQGDPDDPEVGDSDPPIVDTDEPPDTDEPDTDVPDTDEPIDEEFPVATEKIYVNTNTELFTWNPDTTVLTKIGDFRDGFGSPCGNMVDIAIDLSGYMVGTCGTALVKIDPNDATFEPIADLGEMYVGLTFLSDGRLVLAGGGNVKVRDPGTGAQTTIYSGSYITSGDIVGLPDGKLYWTVLGGDDIVVLDPGTGVVTDLGVLGSTFSPLSVWGVGYADGKLFGFSSGGQIVQISPTSGQNWTLQTNPHSWYGATTNPVTW